MSATSILSFRTTIENDIATGIRITINRGAMDELLNDLFNMEYDSLEVDRFDCPIRDKKLEHYITKYVTGDLCDTVTEEIVDRLYNDLVDDYDHILEMLREGTWSQSEYIMERYDRYGLCDRFIDICEECECEDYEHVKYKFGEKVNYDDSDTDTDSPTFITCSICLFKRDTTGDDLVTPLVDTRCCKQKVCKKCVTKLCDNPCPFCRNRTPFGKLRGCIL